MAYTSSIRVKCEMTELHFVARAHTVLAQINDIMRVVPDFDTVEVTEADRASCRYIVDVSANGHRGHVMLTESHVNIGKHGWGSYQLPALPVGETVVKFTIVPQNDFILCAATAGDWFSVVKQIPGVTESFQSMLPSITRVMGGGGRVPDIVHIAARPMSRIKVLTSITTYEAATCDKPCCETGHCYGFDDVIHSMRNFDHPAQLEERKTVQLGPTSESCDLSDTDSGYETVSLCSRARSVDWETSEYRDWFDDNSPCGSRYRCALAIHDIQKMAYGRGNHRFTLLCDKVGYTLNKLNDQCPGCDSKSLSCGRVHEQFRSN